MQPDANLADEFASLSASCQRRRLQTCSVARNQWWKFLDLVAGLATMRWIEPTRLRTQSFRPAMRLHATFNFDFTSASQVVADCQKAVSA